MNAMTEVKPHVDPIAPGLFFVRVFWLDGQTSKSGKGGGAKSEVNSDVPCNGWSSAFLIDPPMVEGERPRKMVTLFCPYTYEGFQVSRGSFEYASIKPPGHSYGPMEELLPRLKQRLVDKWEEGMKLSRQLDYDTAVIVMRMLGMAIPANVLPEGREEKASGGKQADALGLSKPVKRQSRKGQVLAFFWPDTKSIREAMAEFGISRSNILSQLYLLQKDHGIGYELKGDQAHITMPAGCDDPWAEEDAK